MKEYLPRYVNKNEIIKCEIWILNLWILHHFANHTYDAVQKDENVLLHSSKNLISIFKSILTYFVHNSDNNWSSVCFTISSGARVVSKFIIFVKNDCKNSAPPFLQLSSVFPPGNNWGWIWTDGATNRQVLTNFRHVGHTWTRCVTFFEWF